MPIDTKHNQYIKRESDWMSIRDTVDGETAVKARRSTYLPIPPGMIAPSGGEVLHSGKRVGDERYTFYLSFAEFPELISSALNGFQGLIHTHEPVIQLPKDMEYLLTEASLCGDTLIELWEKMTREMLAAGRFILLSDVREIDDKVLIAPYVAENLINWKLQSKQEGGGPDLIVLREIREESKDDDKYVTKDVIYYRELMLQENGQYALQLWKQNNEEGKAIPTGKLKIPELFGKDFKNIPIVVANVHEIGFQYSSIPILPLVRRALAIYRKTADYNRSLYIKSDPQPWISGCLPEHAPQRIGGDTIWTFPNPQATAKYLDIDGKGLPLLRESIKDEYERFYQEGGRLLDTADRSAESGEALRRRQISQQVSLRSVAMNAGVAMQFTLRRMAVYLNQDPTKVRFEANLDFAEPNIDGQELLSIMQSKVLGAPLSDQSIHSRMKRGGLTTKTYEEERNSLQSEPTIVDGLPKAEPTEIEEGNDND